MAMDSAPPGVTLVKILGSGFFGDVWLARTKLVPHGKLCDVALKVPSPKREFDQEEFLKEGRLLQRMDHPNIIKVHKVSVWDGLPYFLMEVAERGSLLDYVKTLSRRTDLTGGRLRCLMAVGVASGMEYLERNRVVHRDLAARNILVMKGGTCKITDFGLTRRMMGRAAGDLAHTVYVYVPQAQGAIPVLWTPPEAFDGIFTTKSDVWSFGVVLWEVMSFGEQPKLPGMGRSGIDKTQLIILLRRGVRLPKPNGCRDNLYQLMLRIWKLNAADRPSFTEIRRALKHIAGGGTGCAIM